MDTKVFCLQSKFKRLLYKLLEGKCPKRVDNHLHTFFSLLCEQEKTEVESTLRAIPIFQEWLKEIVSAWSATKVTPITTIASFTMNLTSLLAKKEERFNNLNTNNFYIKIINITKARNKEIPLSIKLSYIKLLSSFLEHKSGLEWITACHFWEDIYQLTSSEDRKIVEESTKFMSKLLATSIDFDEGFCENVIKKIMNPLGDIVHNSLNGDDLATDSLKPTLDLMGDILDYFLNEIYHKRKDFDVVLLFLKNFHQEERLSDFMVIAQSKNYVFSLGKIMFIMQFLELYVKTITKSISVANINSTITRLRSNFIMTISKGDYIDMMEFSKFGILFWNLISEKFAALKNNVDVRLATELVLFLTMAHWYIFLKYCIANVSLLELERELDEDVVRDMYFDKMMKIFSHDMIRIYYAWRDSLLSSLELFNFCHQSFILVKEVIQCIDRDQATLLFQDHLYIIKDVYNSIKESPEKAEMFSKNPPYFLDIFEILFLLIEKFDITWRDSVEAIELIDISLEVLSMSIPEWPSEIVVKILKLLNIAIVKYMSPNLALLVENPTDSIMDVLGRLVSAKLHCEELGVKRTALDVVCTITTLSRSKFPSLQKVLMDSELPTLVVKMSTCDGESFVRATAIKCLQEMIQVEEIWNNALKSEDLSEKMRHILMNETEGIVRVEAATFMCVAYEHQQFPKESLDGIYETMIYSSTTDLHWEVKVRALNFWDKVIKNHLQNQGMIDDSFPNVTFSKEHRKIVTLTDSEIRKRLLKVLSQLSSIGCLGVLMSAIKDDCDMEVSKTGVKITQRLIDLFKKYNVRSDSSTPSSPAATENGMSAVASVSSGISVDESMDSPASTHPEVNEEVIDQIVNSKDVCLLKNVYTPSDYGSVSNYDIQVRKIVTPNEFLVFCQQDLNSLIAEKKNWLNGIEDLGSLLDDMLKTYDDDVNNMDCY